MDSSIVNFVEKVTKYGMPVLIHSFKKGPEHMKEDSMNAMRIALAAVGWYDPPAM
jgi:hypothetical protein